MTSNGYATEIPYLRDFKPMLAPAWLDHVALVAGVEPPARRSDFAWCDLGCGQGVTAAILAATHPAGLFHGIDAMVVHINHARRLAAEAGIPNACFHATDFADALELELPPFDYIVVHGVYTWVDLASQRALLRFIDYRLKADGLVYLGYNAMPGWACDLPFQKLVRELGAISPGDDTARIAATTATICALANSGVPSLASSYLARELAQRPEDYPAAYLLHELMPAAWQPLYVTEVRAAMATIGLIPVGSATLNENFNWMVLSDAARETLDTISEPDTRELVRDFFLDQRFRRDVFARHNQRLDRDERARRLFSSTFALARPLPAIRYSTASSAGTAIAYDNPATRAILRALAAGPSSLRGGLAPDNASEEAQKALLTLCAAGDIMPVEPSSVGVTDLNRILCRRIDGPEEIRWLALPCGTAMEVDRGVMRLLRDTGEVDDMLFPGWPGFLASHGL